jgi:hypothetical protein
MKIVSVTIAGSREHEIVDAVRSVAAHVDAVLLLDTGATDNTVERARSAAADKLVLACHTWTDFSTARNASLDEARKLGADWIVIVDSDERLHLGAVDLHAALAAVPPTVEILLIDSVDGFYPKEKVVRASASVRYVGPTHEAIVGGAQQVLRGVTFSELAKTPEQLAAKFRRDAELLIGYLVEHGDDPRWWHYLGVSREGLGERELAAKAFGKCVELRRFGQEAGWAAYKQSEMLCMLDCFEDALLAAARGVGADATYAECAWMAGFCAFRLGRIDQAIAWARIAEAVGRFKGCGRDRTHFRHLPAHYELPYDILRYALPDGPAKVQADSDFHQAKLARLGAKSFADLDRTSVSRRAPEPVRSEARGMLRPPTLQVLCDRAKCVHIQFSPPSDWHPMNPSIVAHEGQLWCVVRTINYRLNGRQYTVEDDGGVVRTENFIGVLRPNGKLVGFHKLGTTNAGKPGKPKPMRDRDAAPRVPDARIVGYEDVRLVVLDGRIAGSATVCDRDASRRQIAALHIGEDGAVERAVVQSSQQWHEKNWMPLPNRVGEMAWIVQIGAHVPPGSDLLLDHLRGGAVTALEDGLLAVTHEVVESNECRIYLHRFVRLSADLRVTAVSYAWVFTHHGIEFCAGLATQGDHLVLSYGVEDREAWTVSVPVEQVLQMEWITP